MPDERYFRRRSPEEKSRNGRAVPPGAIPEQVAEAGYRGLMDGRRTVVPGAINKFATFLIRVIPRSVILSFVDHRQKRRRSAPSA